MSELKLDAYEQYWREAAICALEEAGIDINGITSGQWDEIGTALRTSEQCRSQAFYTPESPLRSENERLSRKLKWERELEQCRECKGQGRLRYNAGPWAVDTGCHVCGGAGKIHPRSEREPA